MNDILYECDLRPTLMNYVTHDADEYEATVQSDCGVTETIFSSAEKHNTLKNP